MAMITGVNGAFTLTGAGDTMDGHIYEWRLRDTADIYDSTDFAETTNYTEHIVGLRTCVVEFRGFYDIGVKYELTTMLADRAEATLVLQIGKDQTTSPADTSKVNMKGHVHNRRTRVNKQTGLISLDGTFTGYIETTELT
jgi:hypothetical protein